MVLGMHGSVNPVWDNEGDRDRVEVIMAMMWVAMWLLDEPHGHSQQMMVLMTVYCMALHGVHSMGPVASHGYIICTYMGPLQTSISLCSTS